MAIPERYVLVMVCFCGAAACYMDRVGVPLAYTVMAQVRQPQEPVQTRLSQPVQGRQQPEPLQLLQQVQPQPVLEQQPAQRLVL